MCSSNNSFSAYYSKHATHESICSMYMCMVMYSMRDYYALVCKCLFVHISLAHVLAASVATSTIFLYEFV